MGGREIHFSRSLRYHEMKKRQGYYQRRPGLEKKSFSDLLAGWWMSITKIAISQSPHTKGKPDTEMKVYLRSAVEYELCLSSLYATVSRPERSLLCSESIMVPCSRNDAILRSH
jgi:hypothetical protein